jgi:hypothetical protein
MSRIRFTSTGRPTYGHTPTPRKPYNNLYKYDPLAPKPHPFWDKVCWAFIILTLLFIAVQLWRVFA